MSTMTLRMNWQKRYFLAFAIASSQKYSCEFRGVFPLLVYLHVVSIRHEKVGFFCIRELYV